MSLMNIYKNQQNINQQDSKIYQPDDSLTPVVIVNVFNSIQQCQASPPPLGLVPFNGGFIHAYVSLFSSVFAVFFLFAIQMYENITVSFFQELTVFGWCNQHCQKISESSTPSSFMEHYLSIH